MKHPKANPSEARQRLVERADRLFYAEGIRAVGIDKIIAEAGVAKMTLYTHFASKDELLLAVLHHREASVLEFFQTAIERHAKRSKDHLRAFFAALKEWFESPDFRGCAFQNAAVELADPKHPATQFVREHKKRFTDILRGLIEEALGKGSTSAHLVPMIALLVEGAVVTSVIHGSAEPATVAREAALRLVQRSEGN